MKLIIPDYYEEFKCLGGACKQSCCIGWELEVDEDTYDYYQSIEGPFGDRLKNELRNGQNDGEGSYCFRVPSDGRCPFLNKENLCDIVLELGEESLCDVCTTYPRTTFYYGDTVEKCLSISCEEACRFLLAQRDGLKFLELPYEEYEDYEAYPREPDDSDNTKGKNLEDFDDNKVFDDSDEGNDCGSYGDNDEDYYEPSEEEIEAFKTSQKALFEMLTNRSTPFSKRLINIPNFSDFTELNSKEERLRILSLLEPISTGWTDTLEKLLVHCDDKDLPWEDASYENILIYYLFRYMPRSLFDGDLKSKIRFALFAVYCIRDIENVLGDIALSASLFSREVEHSEDNIEVIMEELLFN